MSDESVPHLSPEQAREYHSSENWRHWVRFAVFLSLYLGGAALVILVSPRMSSTWQYVYFIPAYLLMAASLHGISLFTHEAVHGTLSANKTLNAVLGAACAIPVLQNFSAYRVLHLRHHQHLGEDGDPDHYANYTRWTWLVFTMNWARLIIGYPVYIVAIPILGFKHGDTKARLGIIAEIAVTVIVATLIWLSPVPASWILHVWLIPMLVINVMVNIRGMSQHTLLEDADDEVRGTRSILTGPVVRFFMCNENYHLEHHLYPGVPWHHLPQVHEALEGDLRKHGAPYISSYSSFVGEFVSGSLKRSPLGRRAGR